MKAERTYDHIMRDEVTTFAKNAESRLNIKVNPQRRSLMGILQLFIEPYAAGVRDSKKYVNPDITKMTSRLTARPKRFMITESMGMTCRKRPAVSFIPKKGTSNMDLTKSYTGDKFGFLIDLRPMANIKMHGSHVRLVNTKDGVFLELDRKISGSENLKCHVTSSQSAILRWTLWTDSSSLGSIKYKWTQTTFLLTLWSWARQTPVKPNTSWTSWGAVFEASLMVLICPTFVRNKTYVGFVDHDSRIFVIDCPREEVKVWLRLRSYFFREEIRLLFWTIALSRRTWKAAQVSWFLSAFQHAMRS